ncbi:unnamed protein product [Merluccius merluccius]
MLIRGDPRWGPDPRRGSDPTVGNHRGFRRVWVYGHPATCLGGGRAQGRHGALLLDARRAARPMGDARLAPAPADRRAVRRISVSNRVRAAPAPSVTETDHVGGSRYRSSSPGVTSRGQIAMSSRRVGRRRLRWRHLAAAPAGRGGVAAAVGECVPIMLCVTR